ncbi:MAG: hypothetical protein RMJ54_05940 [Roseiflexaceae bacterium]|nr:hypothetical protein [Roseiflexus sp.]MDW8148371.1 hypothetical protein [Roseiflexaceae bacterium]MDW8232305.1 hypothetical protein [Roseiflexaceae bacterium]
MTAIDGYTRHTFTILFDVPANLTADREVTRDVLNAAVSRVTELIESDERLQTLLRRYGIEYGWEEGSWETMP